MFDSLSIGSGQDAVADVNVDLYVTKEERKQFVTPTDTTGNFVKADAHHLPFADNIFQKVVCSHALEHLLQPYLALKEMYRALKENGVLELSMPNAQLVTHEHPTHLYSWSPDSLCNLLKYVGFKPEVVNANVSGINMELRGYVRNKDLNR